MSSVFRKDDQHVEKPHRVSYPKTFAKNITTKFGQIMPVFCQPVMNGETVELSHKHVFNMLPLVFPVQTRVRASLSYYYVRNRNLWKDWEDFQFKMKPNLVKPYIKFTQESKRDLLRLGGPLDNLGIPVVTKHDTRGRTADPFIYLDMPEGVYKKGLIYNPYTNTYDNYGDSFFHFPSSNEHIIDISNTNGAEITAVPYDKCEINHNSGNAFYFVPFRYNYKQFRIKCRNNNAGKAYFLVRAVSDTLGSYTTSTVNRKGESVSNSRMNAASRPSSGGTAVGGTVSRPSGGTVGSVDTSERTEQTVTQESLALESKYFIVTMRFYDQNINNNYNVIQIGDYTVQEVLGVYYADDEPSFYNVKVELGVNPSDYPTHGIHISDVSLWELPFANSIYDDNTRIRLDALPLRAVESIYNARIRHADNNPYKINGVAEYNKYLSNVNGGADTFNYPQRYANWEDDMFTTALHTPQHGEAPLVGLTNQGETPYRVTFANDDGTKSTVHFGYDSQVGAVKVYHDANDPDREGYTGQLQEAMIEAVKFGITINDFRNVNSFQRWLENNVRKGYKYRDQIKAHYGISVRYDVLDMPEYLGGTSRDMSVNQVTQTTENENGVLGDYAGQAYINGGSDHKIHFMADEEGFIIGLLTILPSANYSQTIPKFWMRENALDYYSPEFGKIGYQPILNKEIDPIGSFIDGTADKVFGYQRPWYDYISTYDTIHGKFRTQFQNFVLTRQFANTPELTEDFLVFNPDHLNNVFYVDDDEDKILGQILFEYNAKLPIPMYGVPALE